MKTVLSPTERRALRARAHPLVPVVMIADKGLSASVIREIDRSLKAHELIKIRAMTDDREARAAWLEEICAALNAAAVQSIGKIFVIWRENPELVKARAKAAAPPVVPRPKRLTKREEEAVASGQMRRRRVTKSK